MWERRERSPVLAAPGSNSYAGLIAGSTNAKSGSGASNFQGLSNEDANDLCKRYLPLANKIAGQYEDRGVDFDDLESASLAGLVVASRKYDPQRGAFGPYARFWIKGEIRALFKPREDALAIKKPKNPKAPDNYRGRALSLDAPIAEESESTFGDVATGQSMPVVSLDLSALSEMDRNIIEARSAGYTLTEVGKVYDLSAERVRQRESRALRQIRGAVASRCVSDLTKRDDQVHLFPGTKRDGRFRDRPPPKHALREPEPSKELRHHRKHAARLAVLRCDPTNFHWGRE
jgi:RNA polymerase sigma factor (sigma-70 family)